MVVTPGLAYRGEGTALARLHPLVKLVWLLALDVAVFVVGRAPFAVALLGALLGLAALPSGSGGALWQALRGRRMLAWSVVTLFLLQALCYRQGTVLLHLWPWGAGALPVTDAGLGRGALIAARFGVIVVSSQLFVLLTEPGALAYALMRAGLPYRYGFALVTALRMAALFEGEAATVYEAQLARGVRYDVRGPRRVLALLRQFMLPLLVSAVRRAETLAISMEGRHFGRFPTRTYLRTAHLSRADALALGLLAGFVALSAFLARR